MSNKNKPANKDDKSSKEKESKVVKFKRVCTPRLRKALKAISLISNCSTKDYAYNKEQSDKIINSLTDAVAVLEKKFTGTAAAESAIEL